MMRAACTCLLLLTLAACGEDGRHEGTLSWDAGNGVLEITGTGPFTLELNHRGTAPFLVHRPDGSPPTEFTAGASMRVRDRGRQTWRFTLIDGKEAHLAYSFEADEGTHVHAYVASFSQVLERLKRDHKWTGADAQKQIEEFERDRARLVEEMRRLGEERARTTQEAERLSEEVRKLKEEYDRAVNGR